MFGLGWGEVLGKWGRHEGQKKHSSESPVAFSNYAPALRTLNAVTSPPSVLLLKSDGLFQR